MSRELFEKVLLAQSASLDTQGFRINHDPSRTRVAVIVEPREHPFLRAVVQNVMSFLGPSWNLHIFTSDERKSWLVNELSPHEYQVHYLHCANMTPQQYSELLLSPPFWNVIREENVLIFQTDCIVFRTLEEHFLDCDYVGGNFFNSKHTAPVVGGIQGGLSLRKRSAMLDCLSKVSIDDMNRHRTQHGYVDIQEPPEDVYFTHACEILKKNVMEVSSRRTFAIEAEFFDAPFGFHGWVHPYFSLEQSRQMIMHSMLGYFL